MDKPRKDSSGSASVTWGERRMQGGKMTLVTFFKHWRHWHADHSRVERVLPLPWSLASADCRKNLASANGAYATWPRSVRSTQRYKCRRKQDPEFCNRLRAIALERPCFGYRCVHTVLLREGFETGIRRTYNQA